MTADVIIKKLREVIPNDILDFWYELPRNIDNMVAHDFIRDVLKGALINVHNEISKKLKIESEQEIAVLLDYQQLIIQGLGMIEIYLADF